MFKKILLSLFVLIFSLGLFGPILAAEEELDADILTEEEEEDLEITAEDLGVEEQGGIFAWFRNVVRNVQILITRNPLKKAELKLEKASTRLLRAKQKAEERADEESQAELDELVADYEELTEQINQRLEKLKSENPDNSELSKFLEKYSAHEIKHQEILKRLEEQVPEEVAVRIRERRERHLEKFGQVMNRLQEKEEFKNQLKEVLEDKKATLMQRIRRMEIVEELGEEADNQEIKERVYELRIEQKRLFNQLKEEREEIIRERRQVQQKNRETNQGE